MKNVLLSQGNPNLEPHPGAGTLTTDLGGEIGIRGFFQTELGQFLSKGITAAIIVGAILVLLYLLWGAIDWLTSEGDKDKLSSARSKIIQGIIGLALLVAVWAVWRLVLEFLGLEGSFPVT